MRCMVSDVILLGCSTSVSSEVIFESIMDAENVNNMLQLYRNTMIMVIRIKRKAYLIMIIGNYAWQEISVYIYILVFVLYLDLTSGLCRAVFPMFLVSHIGLPAY